MGKISSFGTTLEFGVAQVETATVIGTVTGSGNATVVTTCTGMTGSAITTNVAVLNGDSASAVAVKIAAALNLVANITAKFAVTAAGANVILTKLIPAANIADVNLSIDNGSCSGLTTAASSADTRAGMDYAEVANVSNLSGPGLALDTEDVTTHDSISGFEEVVGTILRTGELTLDIAYDPAEDTIDASSGLVYLMKNNINGWFIMTFPDTTIWSFRGYVTSFEPSAPHDGALTGSVKIKLNGAPTLA